MTLPSPPAEPTPARDPADIERAVAAFGLMLLSPATEVGESVLNENYRVDTNDGPRFLRYVWHDRPAERVLSEYGVMTHAARKGIPVPLPAVVEGKPYVSLGGQIVQLFPWVEGHTGEPTPADALAMGEMQAAAQVALEDFSDPLLTDLAQRRPWDTERAIRVLSRIDDLIRYYPAPSPEQLRVQDAIRLQLELLESPAARPPEDYAAVPVQVCHSDYHNRNILVGPEGHVVAVVDWEIANVMPPVFELVRALSFSDYLEPPLVRAYLAGYARKRMLSGIECELGVEMWWQSRIHSTWVYEVRFIRGERGVDRFMETEAALLRRFADSEFRGWLRTELERSAT